MSETPSLSSVDFMRSVMSLTQDGSPPPTFDADMFPPRDMTPREKPRPSLLGRSDSQRLSIYDSNYAYAPNRVFINGIDAFTTKHIARFLVDQQFGILKPPPEEDEAFGEGEELYDDMDFLFSASKDREPAKVNYKVCGTRLTENGEFDRDKVSVVDSGNRERLFQRLATCGFIIYDVSRHPDQIAEARWALRTLLGELERLERSCSQASEVADVPAFVLISTFMTWAQTRPVDAEEPTLPLREMDYKSRRPHPNFRRHFELENEVVEAGRAFPHRFRTLVVCAGVPYGFEEDTLHFLFKMGWENVPALPLFAQGRNFVPLVHVRDLAMMVFNVLELFPNKLRYLLAVEQNLSSMRTVTKAISSALTTGETVPVSREEMLLLNVPQYVYDCLTVNVRMEPQYFVELETMHWTELSFAENIDSIIQEFRESRGLIPLRVLIVGPPVSGKTTLAKRICEYYGLHYVSEKNIPEIVMQRLKDKICRIKEKEQQAAEREAEKELEKLLKSEEEEGQEEGAEEEEAEEELLEEVEEEAEESVAKLQEAVDDLAQALEDNDGHLDAEAFQRCASEVLASPPLRNQGFVLDGFPETADELRVLFDEKDFAVEEEEPRPLDLVVALDASDDFLVARALALPEPEVQRRRCNEEELVRRLDEYRLANEDGGLPRFMAENELAPLAVDAEADEAAGAAFERVRRALGEPRTLGRDAAEAAARRAEEEERRRWDEAKDLARKQEAEKAAHAERVRRLREWAATMDALRADEEEAFARDGAALRHYLAEYVFPTLTRGLQETARLRPADPVDFLAEFLFRYNPDGKIFAPDDTFQARKLYAAIARDVKRLFGPKDGAAPPTRSLDVLDLQVGERPARTYY